MKIRVLLVSKFEQNIEFMKNMIDDEEITVIGESIGGTAALEKIESTSPDLVIMTLGIGDTDILSLTERIILHRPKTQVILLTEYIDVDILQCGMKAGAHNIIEFPKNPKEFATYIKSVFHNETIRLQALDESRNLSWMSRTVTVFGGKGGLGKTTLAVNLAVKLAESGKKVALIDLDLQFGDVSIFMDMEPADTILELIQESFTSNIDSIRSFMAVHSSGVHILSAPRSPEYAEMVSAEKVQNLLNLLRTYYDFVVIDTPSFYNEITLAAIEGSSNILFVTGLDDISTLKNSKLSLSLLKSLQQGDKVKLIANKVDDIGSLTLQDVEEVLGYPVVAKIPREDRVARAGLNRGIPFVISNPASKPAQAITIIADLILQGNGNGNGRSVSEKKNEQKSLLKSKRRKGLK
ncbi:MAG: AAA family ATPase [Eubacteriales bacterium]|nr:AAA family ATPase [Eubacteriales bacterium]